MLKRTCCAAMLSLVSLVFMPNTGGAVTVSVDPPDTSVAIGDEFVLRIVTDAFPDLKGFKLVFPYDAGRVVLLSVTPGEVLTGSGNAYVDFLLPDIAPPADSLSYDAAMLEGTTQGPGILVYARFKALASGDAGLNCGSVDFRDSNNNRTTPSCIGGVVHIASASPPIVRISQVYGGGGNSGAALKNDFIELFNPGDVAADVTGWSVQYASATGSTWQSTPLSGAIPPGGYYLVQEAQGAGGVLDLPTPDAVGGIPMSATSAKVALVSSTAPLTGTCPASATILDLVGYGAASCSETLPAPALGNLTAALRVFGGCQDTDNNSTDFTPGAPTPRNTASAPNPCEFTLDVSTDPVAGGTVTRSPDQSTYTFGASVDLTAQPAPGFFFLNWSGDATGSQNPVTVVMSDDKTIVAHFTTVLAPHPIVVSQVYGGGGNSGATYKNDYVELFNRSANAVDITGWSVQYASSSGSTWLSTSLSGTIQPGHYYLVQEAAGAGGIIDLPPADAFGSTAMSANSGKVALVNNGVSLAGNCPAGAGIEDMVGYGPADCAEGSPTPALNNLSASLRNDGGCVDTDNNLADFTTLAPNPRNSAAPAHVCSYLVSVGDPPAPELSLGVVPNPTPGSVLVHFSLPRPAAATLRVFDLQGRVVAKLVDTELAAGRHEVQWNGMTPAGPARSGIYFVRLQVPGETMRRAVVIAR